jgi:hypothetical protein
MADTYIVNVNLEQLRARCSLCEQRVLTDAEARLWLIRYGFYPRPDGLFIAEEAVLRQLDPSEIVTADPVG